jgi:putative ABC transport system permease protein
MLIANYFRTTFRHFLRHKSFFLINILGLSIGIAACLLIYGHVHHQGGFDSYHPKADRIARVTLVFHAPESDLVFATTMAPLAGALVRDCPQVENAVRIQTGELSVGKGTNSFAEANFVYSEQSVFSIFYFNFLEGTAAGALSTPNSIVLTKSMARKYFGDSAALGKTLRCDKITYRVTAVIADRPSNSDLKMDALVWKDFQHINGWMENDFEVYTFVLFRGQPDLTALKKQMAVLSSTYVQPELEKMEARQYKVIFDAELLADVHFSKGKLVDTPKGNRLFNTIFSMLAVFILLVALLNYVNLSTARAEERAREVAIRKVAGARPLQLMGQFIGESFFLMAIAWLLGIIMTRAAVPFFNRILSTDISFGGIRSLLLLVLLIPLTALLAGAWPAFVLSGFPPVKVLKGLAVRSKGIGLRKVLTVVQFIIALTMLTGTVVIYRQMHYILHKDLGADRSQVVSLGIPRDSISLLRMDAFSRAIRQEAGVLGVSAGSGIPIEGVMMASTTTLSAGRKKEILCNYFFIDPQFLPLMHIGLAEGRNLSDSMRTDRDEGFIVNEAFVRSMGWKKGEGLPIEGNGHKGKIIGVVKDFFFKSLHNAIEPAVMIRARRDVWTVLIKAPPSLLPRLRTLWNSYFPLKAFSYFYLDESFDGQYKDDRITMSLFNGFTALAIFISCLGLYGLVSLITVRRTREIGIRKVLGASGRGLVLLLTREFFLLIGCAALVALPLAGWGLHGWLSSYAYHTELKVWMFCLPLVLLVLVTLSVTGLRVIRAVLANPVDSLRAE